MNTSTRGSQGKKQWQRVERVFQTASVKPRYLGFIDLTRNQPFPYHAYLLKTKKPGRIKKTVFDQRSQISHSKRNAHRERTPGLMVTSLEGAASITHRIVHHYQTRIQIVHPECLLMLRIHLKEGFCDVKNPRWGFSLSEARITVPIGMKIYYWSGL